MKKINMLKKVMALVLAVGLIISVGVEAAHAEYIDRAAKERIYFGPGIDLFPKSGGIAGVKYLGPIMAPASYASDDPFTVAKLASVWARILELKPDPGAPVPKDVKRGKWYYGAFERLSKTHILDFLKDKNGNIHPDRQLYVYEIHRSVKYYWDYSGFSELKANGFQYMQDHEVGTGFMFFNYGAQSVNFNRLKRVGKKFRERYAGRPWLNDVAQVMEVGLDHGIDYMYDHTYKGAVDKATNARAMHLFFNITGRDNWFGSQGYKTKIKIKGGIKNLPMYEEAALQSCPPGFIN